MNRAPHIAIIAGEVSGDMLGADLMQALKAQLGEVSFSGVGGDHMSRQGLNSLFPMQEIALMGFAEILPHLFRIKRRMREAIEALRTNPPDILITIDSPGFTFRVAKALQELPFPKVHYVAPTVWAYKPERAAKTAALFDHLLALLPFEPPYFEKEGMKASFIGHPSVWRNKDITPLPQPQPTLALLPGSRRGELKRHLPIFQQTVQKLKNQLPELSCVMPIPPHLFQEVSAKVKRWDVDVRMIESEAEKLPTLAGCTAALAKSGTVSLELACAKLPTVTTYRASPLTAFLVRRMWNSPFVNLVNLIAHKAIVPEHLQEACNSETLSKALLPLLSDSDARDAQIVEFDAALHALGRDDEESPSAKAAHIIAEYLS